MTRKLAIVCVALTWAWLGSLAVVARAQDPILTELYGTGVHEYFSGGYQQSIADLTQAIKGGSKDPRVYYYFRRRCTWLQSERHGQSPGRFRLRREDGKR